MEKLIVGDKLEIHCYKHNGKIHRTWNESIILDITKDLLICGNNKALITEKNGRSHTSRETTIIFFYAKRWFNVFAQFKKRGLFYKCNIATPYLIDDNIIKFIDYDLDLKVYPDGAFKVLDRNEYKYHKTIMKYPEEIDIIINKELQKLIKIKKNNKGPFDKNEIKKYKNLYEELNK